MANPPPLHAIILTGGASRRMGADKAELLWHGQRAVDRLAGLARSLGAARIITAGDGDYGFERVRDPAPQSGPVAGVLAALAVLDEERLDGNRALVLAVDAPTLTAGDLTPLLAQEPPGAAYAGLPLPMVLALAATPQDAQADWPLRRLVERAGLAQLAAPPEIQDRLRGANTPQERARLLGQIGPD